MKLLILAPDGVERGRPPISNEPTFSVRTSLWVLKLDKGNKITKF